MIRPVAMAQADLADTLRYMAALVDAADSFEGHIEYLMPGPEDNTPEGTYAMVKAGFRVGNRMGQGGFRTIGEYPSEAVADA